MNDVFNVYKAVIFLSKDNIHRYENPIPITLSSELFYKFKWDRINRLDFMGENAIVLLAEDKHWLESYLIGFYDATQIDKSFSDTQKEKIQQNYEKYKQTGESDLPVFASESNVAFFRIAGNNDD